MIARHFFDGYNHGGAAIPALRTEGKVTLAAEMNAKAITYLVKHAEDAELLMDILGLANDCKR